MINKSHRHWYQINRRRMSRLESKEERTEREEIELLQRQKVMEHLRSGNRDRARLTCKWLNKYMGC